jgi:hypothetical protein
MLMSPAFSAASVVGGKRLFAEHVLAGGDGGHGGAVVDAVGRDVGHGIELAPCQRLGEALEAPVDAVPVAEGRKVRRIDIDSADQADPGNRRKVLGMVFGHPAGAEDE